MAGFQFGHIATFSFKGNGANFSIDEVAAEAARLEGSHPHVAEPLPPTLLAGDFTPENVPAEIRRRMAEAKKKLKGVRTEDGKVQRIRENTHLMEAQVHSHPIYTKPPPPEHDGEQRPSMADPVWRRRYLSWRSELVYWIKEDAGRRGLVVLSVVEHVDEAHPHIHALLVPRQTEQNPRMDAKVTHPGHAARERRQKQARKRLGVIAPASSSLAEAAPAIDERSKARRRRGSDIGRRISRAPAQKKEQSKTDGAPTLEQLVTAIGTRAYKAAMRGWQNHLYETLSIRHGLTRVGPRLERLSRKAWRRRQNENEVTLKSKELATTLATVADNFSKVALVAEGTRQAAEKEAADLKEQVATLQAKVSEMAKVVQVVEQQEERVREQLAARLAEVAAAEDKLKQAQAAEDTRLRAEERAAELEKEIKESSAKLAEARDVIRKSNQLGPQIQALKNEEAGIRRRLAEVSDEVAEAERNIKLAQDAEVDRKQSEVAAAEAEKRRQTAEAAIASLEKREAEVSARENNVRARALGLRAWATGNLGLNDEGQLAILDTKTGPETKVELASLQPAEGWLIGAVKALNSRLDRRVEKVIADVVKVAEVVVRAWAKGLVVYNKIYTGKVGVMGGKFQKEADELARDIYPYPEVMFALVPVLPDIREVHKVVERAKKMEETLTVAELRSLNELVAKTNALRGKGPGGR